MKEKRIGAQAVLEPVVSGVSSGEALTAFLDRPLLTMVRINWETVTWLALLITAFALRLYDVGVRAMSIR